MKVLQTWAADFIWSCVSLRVFLVVMVVAYPYAARSQVHRLIPPNSRSFGFAVSSSGDRIAVGAPEEGAGAVYVYVRDAVLGWRLEVRVEGSAHERFGSSVALDDRYLLVGAPGGGTMAGGHAYLYEQDAGVWSETARLESPSPRQGDAFGTSVAVFGVYAIAGAPLADAGTGMVYVFERTGPSLWQYRQTLRSGEAAGHFGSAIALISEWCLIGAPEADEPRGQAAGKAYLFERTGGSDWAQRATLVAGDASGHSHFGTAVAVGQNDQTGIYSAWVGAPAAGPQQSGAAYLFRIHEGQWAQRARYTAPSLSGKNRIGHSVGVFQDHFLVGMPGVDLGAGAFAALTVDTLVYAWQERAWHYAPQRQDSAHFGYVVAASQDFVAVGAPGDARTDSTSGAVYVYPRSVALPREAARSLSSSRSLVFPNPFSDVLTITVEGMIGPDVAVGIYDVWGRRVGARKGVRDSWRWHPAASLPNGVYVVFVRGERRQEVQVATRVR